MATTSPGRSPGSCEGGAIRNCSTATSPKDAQSQHTTSPAPKTPMAPKTEPPTHSPGISTDAFPTTGSNTISTLDLLSDGLTLLSSTEVTADTSRAAIATTAPTVTHIVGDTLVRHLGLQPSETLLLRPDGRTWASTNPA